MALCEVSLVCFLSCTWWRRRLDSTNWNPARSSSLYWSRQVAWHEFPSWCFKVPCFWTAFLWVLIFIERGLITSPMISYLLQTYIASSLHPRVLAAVFPHITAKLVNGKETEAPATLRPAPGTRTSPGGRRSTASPSLTRTPKQSPSVFGSLTHLSSLPHLSLLALCRCFLVSEVSCPGGCLVLFSAGCPGSSAGWLFSRCVPVRGCSCGGCVARHSQHFVSPALFSPILP